MPESKVSYAVKALTPFIGAKIIDLVEDDEGMLGIVIEQENDQTILWVQRDAEGNGPGWIFPDPQLPEPLSYENEVDNAEGN